MGTTRFIRANQFPTIRAKDWLPLVACHRLPCTEKNEVSAWLVTKQSVLLFALDITEKGAGWSQQKRPHAPPDIADYLILLVLIPSHFTVVKEYAQATEFCLDIHVLKAMLIARAFQLLIYWYRSKVLASTIVSNPSRSKGGHGCFWKAISQKEFHRVLQWSKYVGFTPLKPWESLSGSSKPHIFDHIPWGL